MVIYYEVIKNIEVRLANEEVKNAGETRAIR